MDLSQYVDEPTIAALQRLLPGVAFEPIITPIVDLPEPSIHVNLPVATGAEYSFRLWFRPEKQISAALIDANSVHQDFWERPFEDAEFKNSAVKLNAAFLETVKLLAMHETRIVQKTGLLFHWFRCEYKTGSGWNKVYSMGCLRMGRFKTPRIVGRKHVYHSPALASYNN